MKIALVNPQTDVEEMREMYSFHENLGLGLISSFLKQSGFDVTIYDLRVQRLSERELADELIANNVRLIGLSTNYATLPSALKIAQLVKLQTEHTCYVALGGEHVTYLDEKILRGYSCVDFVVRGEGEDTFLSVATKIRDRLSLKNVNGTSYYERNIGQFCRASNQPPRNELKAFPFADRSIARHALKTNIPIEIGILAQRGCPFPCAFCNANRFLGNETTGLRFRDPSEIAAEMESIEPLFSKKTSFLRFYDATFVTRSNQSRKWAEELCKEIERRGVRIPLDVFIRTDSFRWGTDDDMTLLRRLRQAGVISTYLGLEAGDDTTLDLYNKKISTNLSLTAFNTLYELGMTGSTNGCITFHQDVNIQQIRNTIRLLQKIGLCTFWNITSRAETLPGIELSKNMMLHERRTAWDVENYSFTDTPAERIYALLSSMKKAFIAARYEDYLCRTLRDRARIRAFYAGEYGIGDEEAALNAEIAAMQQRTSGFLEEVMEKAENDVEWNLTTEAPIVGNYIDSMMESLRALRINHGGLLHETNKPKANLYRVRRPLTVNVALNE